MLNMSEKYLFRTILLVLVFATGYRLFPVIAGQPWLSEFFVTEDGYLMLTVARNMAIGNGMSVSAGEVATNGVQPLATFLFALPYVLLGGDKLGGLTGYQLISVALSVAGLFAVRAVARLVLQGHQNARLWSWGVAALWYCSPLLLFHSMNGLETGLYTLVVMLVLLRLHSLAIQGAGAPLKERLWFGAICGIAFLARNDAVFLVIIAYFTWGFYELLSLRLNFFRILARIVPSGIICLIVAAPWLINNKLRFGSIMPISGSSQSFWADYGLNLPILPAKLFEYFFPFLPVPTAFETNPMFVIPAVVLMSVIFGSFIVLARRHSDSPLRVVLITYVGFAAALSVYYGVFFGAPHFLSRYLAPAAPLLIAMTVGGALAWFASDRWRLASALRVVTGLALILSVLLLIRLALPGQKEQGHFQIVNWVNNNLPAETWAGAPQTGTLGYWHDRTINLDGKTNPAALEALLADRHLPYVIESPVDVIADWNGITGWVTDNPDFARHFEIIVDDPEHNLGVLRRRNTSE